MNFAEELKSINEAISAPSEPLGQNFKIEMIFKIVDGLKEILDEDRKQKYPLFLNVHEQFLLKIVKNIVNRPQTNYIIGITGESASGKTTLVNYATKALLKGDEDDLYTVISCDDYYYDTSKELKEAGSYEQLYMTGFSFDTPKAINLELMKAHLISLKNGCGVIAPEYNFVTCESTPNTIYKKPSKVILNEGLYVLNETMQGIHDIKIYIYTPFNVIKDRWFARAALRGKTGKAADLQFADVNETAQTFIRPTMNNADVVISGLTSADYIQYLTTKILNFVREITLFYR